MAIIASRMTPSPPWVSAVPIRHRRRHRAVFVAAGAYNIGWGLFTATHPQWLFDLTGMPPANHPQVFATLGMVVGLYGILYLSVAAYPEHGWLCAAVGMTGKLLGPVGLAALLIQGTWPPGTAIICLTNDIVWWVPFGQYLRDARPRKGHAASTLHTASPQQHEHNHHCQDHDDSSDSDVHGSLPLVVRAAG